jgi:hypothetical protein
MKGKLTLSLTKTITGDDLDEAADQEVEKLKAAAPGYEIDIEEIEEEDDDGDEEEETSATPGE